MLIAALLFALSGDMTGLELQSVASRFARNNWISKGHCARFSFQRSPDIKICRLATGHPYHCKVLVFSSWMKYELEVCEEFNPI